MEEKIKNLIIIVMAMIICILLVKIYFLYRNYNLINKIDDVNSAYIGDIGDRYFEIESTIYDYNNSNEEEVSKSKVYKKDSIIKVESQDSILYENFEEPECYYINLTTNTVSNTASFVDEFSKFLQIYYKNLADAKITTDKDNYILTIKNSKYYFDKKNYRIVKEELSNDVHVIDRIVYTYYDDIEVTNDNIAKPEILNNTHNY